MRAALEWGRAVPVLYLAAENDVSLPPEGVREMFDRTPGSKRMVILGRADHMHFMDDVETRHETVRGMDFGPQLAWLRREMRPIAQLCTGEQAHLFTRGVTLAHFDATLRGDGAAGRFPGGCLAAELAARGIAATVVESESPHRS